MILVEPELFWRRHILPVESSFSSFEKLSWDNFAKGAWVNVMTASQASYACTQVLMDVDIQAPLSRLVSSRKLRAMHEDQFQFPRPPCGLLLRFPMQVALQCCYIQYDGSYISTSVLVLLLSKQTLEWSRRPCSQMNASCQLSASLVSRFHGYVTSCVIRRCL